MTRSPDAGRNDYSGQAWYQGRLMDGAEAMERAGIQRLVPEAKEGLALTNGTTYMTAAAALAIADADNLIRHAEIAQGGRQFDAAEEAAHVLDEVVEVVGAVQRRRHRRPL